MVNYRPSYSGADPEFFKRGGEVLLRSPSEKGGGPGGGPSLGPMLKSLYRGPRGGVQTPCPPPDPPMVLMHEDIKDIACMV